MSNDSDDDLLLGLTLGWILSNEHKSGGNSGCFCVILAVLAVPALFALIAIAA